MNQQVAPQLCWTSPSKKESEKKNSMIKGQSKNTSHSSGGGGAKGAKYNLKFFAVLNSYFKAFDSKKS